ncbi:unnamed protein product [Sympodiomycopsis kandeliae]
MASIVDPHPASTPLNIAQAHPNTGITALSTDTTTDPALVARHSEFEEPAFSSRRSAEEGVDSTSTQQRSLLADTGGLHTASIKVKPSPTILTHSPPPNRSRLQSLARSSPSLAYPDHQPYSATTTSTAGSPHQSSALHSLQAAVTAGSASPAFAAQTFPQSQSTASAMAASPPSSASGGRSGGTTASMTTPHKKRTSLTSPMSSGAESLPRSRSYFGPRQSLEWNSSSSPAPSTISPTTSQTGSRLHFTSFEDPHVATTFKRERQSTLPIGVHEPRRPSLPGTSSVPTMPMHRNESTPRLRPRMTARPVDHLEAKVVILGAQGVGKTSIVHRYTSGQFNASSVPSTIGASFLTKKLVVDNVKCRLQLWDTAGQERFRSMAPMYYRGSHAAVIVYDVTSKESFADVKTWIEELKMNMSKDLVIHVVGSKIDLAPFAREVDPEEAREQVLRWLYPDRELAALALANPSEPSLGSPSSASAKQSSTSGSSSRLGTLGSLAIGSASRLGAAFPSSSRNNTVSKSTFFGGSSGASVPGTSASNGSSSEDVEAETALPILPGDESDLEVTEVSAKVGVGIEDVFVAVTQKLVLQRIAIEQQRRERERNSIFLSADDFDNDRQNNGAPKWTCC